MNWLINGVERKAEEKGIDYEIIQYGLKVEISFLIDVLLSLLACSFIHQTLYALFFIITFSYLRIYCGGYHCKTYVTCGFFYVVMVFTSCLLKTALSLQGYAWLFVIPFTYLYLVSPIQNENNILCEKEITVFRQKARERLIIIGMIYCYLLLVRVKEIQLMICLSLYWLMILCLIQQFQIKKGK